MKVYLIFVMGEALDQEMIMLGKSLMIPVISLNVGNLAAQVMETGTVFS